jgi:hypothetical protein
MADPKRSEEKNMDTMKTYEKKKWMPESTRCTMYGGISRIACWKEQLLMLENLDDIRPEWSKVSGRDAFND